MQIGTDLHSDVMTHQNSILDSYLVSDLDLKSDSNSKLHMVVLNIISELDSKSYAHVQRLFKGELPEELEKELLEELKEKAVDKSTNISMEDLENIIQEKEKKFIVSELDLKSNTYVQKLFEIELPEELKEKIVDKAIDLSMEDLEEIIPEKKKNFKELKERLSNY